jgi:phosphate transport system substrate-binding protein
MKSTVKILILAFALYACGTNSEKPIINKGNARIAVDESLQPIIQAQISAYRFRYPKTSIIPQFVSEHKAIALLLKDSVDMAATTREFNEAELKVLSSRGIKYMPARMAIDAVAIIMNKNAKDSIITIDQLKELLTSNPRHVKLVFDRASSSNLNLMMEKLKIKKLNTTHIYAAEGNLNVVNKIKQDPQAIGFIGFNWISDNDNRLHLALKNSIRLLGVAENANKGYFKPTTKNIRDRKYPLERFVYLHTLDKTWGVENGFIRFSCSKVGQLVTEKMGLVPFYKIPKEFLLDTTPLSKKLEQ